MANSRQTARTGGRGWARGRKIVLTIAIVLAVVMTGIYYLSPLRSYGAAGTAYGARVACSCRFVAGRSLDDCAKDKVAGMELIRISEDRSERSVTATLPFVASDRAIFREGEGCVLVPWDG